MKPKMKRLCVFCGRNPQSKNREHILPQWLIAHTGSPDRKVMFGHDKNTGRPRLFAYQSFTFPACEECNSRFSSLEATTKPILLELLDSKPLSNIQLHYLLDWFDKVRVGLWLAFYFLDKNIGGIQPMFHIASRIGLHDRILQIIRVEGGGDDLSFRGCDMPAFYYTPSCFSMIINTYCFINISSPFLFSQAIGFPYPKCGHLRDDGLVDYELADAKEELSCPVMPGWLEFEGTALYQPMFGCQARIPAYQGYYNNAYVRKNSLSFERGIGQIFIEKGDHFDIAASGPTAAWVPRRSYQRLSMNPQISTHTIRLQLSVDRLIPSYSRLKKETRNWWDEALRTNREYGEAMIAVLEHNARRIGPKQSAVSVVHPY